MQQYVLKNRTLKRCYCAEIFYYLDKLVLERTEKEETKNIICTKEERGRKIETTDDIAPYSDRLAMTAMHKAF